MSDSAFLLDQMLALADAMRAQQVAALGQARREAGTRAMCPRNAPHDTVTGIAAEILSRRSRGESLGSIAHALNCQGVKGRYGARWYTASVRAYLRRIRPAI
ncbi:recombinase family protein [Noviherbaspirillum saxi]|uniref:Recombinase domain-containing protein n=1 Tax=Noviherbaspirillum saxi TaxID=2320863 RepID=A0A3A3FGS7_9BURK|nr:recombinase family protein [Noviherbaspirillum saxi]RJF92347.1 hypothetical protein D3871_27375 [Noviherbaspirillum saxi]